MGFQNILNGLKDANDFTKKVNSEITNSNPSQEPGKLNQINTQLIGITKNVTGTFSNISNVGKSISQVSKTLGNTSIGKSLGLGKISDILTGTDSIQYTPSDDDIKKSEAAGELTGLKGFYNKLGGVNNNGLYGSNHIDTQNTFECWFEFEPDGSEGDQESFIETLVNENKINAVEYENFTKEHATSLIDYTKARVENICLVDMGVYIQKFTLPNITTNSNGTAQTMIGEFPLNGSYVKPDSHTFTMDVINTRNPFHEVLFYPWMREVQMNKWQYKNQPYTTANIHIDMVEHSSIEYILLNCRPSQIMTYQPSQEPNSNFTRQIQFIFDYMVIKRHDELIENGYGSGFSPSFKEMDKKQEKSTLDKIADVAGAVNFAASNILKI